MQKKKKSAFFMKKSKPSKIIEGKKIKERERNPIICTKVSFVQKEEWFGYSIN